MLRGIWARFVLVVLTVMLGLPVVPIALVVPRWSDLSMRAGRVWSRVMLAVVGARVRYEHLSRAREHVPCVFIANHQSMVDIWALIRILPVSARFVAKRELFRIPVFGWVLSAAGFVPIDRANRAAAIESLREAARSIRAGRTVVLFPEGTRTRDGHLRPFKKGAFHLALEAGVPVVPVTIRGSFEVLPPRGLAIHPGEVRVRFGAPIDVSPWQPDDYLGLLAVVHEAIARDFADAGLQAAERGAAGVAAR